MPEKCLINRYREIPTTDPVNMTWKLLRYFLDKDVTVERIVERHKLSGEALRKQKTNIAKQAIQIGYCLRQAEEYFHASQQVTLATRPNLLYYGAVSLSQALVLTVKDGHFSLDKRRATKPRQHSHHGLELCKGPLSDKNFPTTKNPALYFDRLQCKLREDNGFVGHFPVYYDSLVPPVFGIRTTIGKYKEIRTQTGRSSTSSKSSRFSRIVLAHTGELRQLESIKMPFNVLSLIKGLPDLCFILSEINIEPNLIHCAYHIRRKLITRDINSEVSNTVHDSHQFVADCTKLQRDSLVDFWRKKNTSEAGDFQSIEQTENHQYFVVNVEYADQESFSFYMPDIVEDLAGEKYLITNPDDYLAEPIAYMIILYCLSMLARYYPDVWMRTVLENPVVAETIETILVVAYRKMPLLILDQMTSTKHCFRQ